MLHSYENTNVITHTATEVVGKNTVMTVSGKDTTLTGSQVKGEAITTKVGGNLSITSVQDREMVTADREAFEAGGSIGLIINNDYTVQSGYTKGKTESTYNSVTQQVGIYAGQEGFHVDVGDTTNLTYISP